MYIYIYMDTGWSPHRKVTLVIVYSMAIIRLISDIEHEMNTS